MSFSNIPTDVVIVSFSIGFITAVILIIIILKKIFNNKNNNNNNMSINYSTNMANNKIRHSTYLPPIPNTWYHLCNSNEIKKNQVKYVRALGQNFAIWRTDDNEPIVMSAFCPHLGANIGVNGKIINNKIKCPFHGWEFNKNGELELVPYINDNKKLPKCKKIKTYKCKDWCNWLCVYFHADYDEICINGPEFDLPKNVENELNNGWHILKSISLGHKQLSVIDWVDQSSDHSHFEYLHGKFFLPYTQIPLPQFLYKLVDIKHKVTTVLGKKWTDDSKKYSTEYYGDNKDDVKQYLYFVDEVIVAYNKKELKFSKSITKEWFIGPSIMIFHIPIKNVGSIKIFVSTTPTVNEDGISGGSFMRLNVWLSNDSWLLYFVSWIVVGISYSQLAADIIIMENKVRLKKPCITKHCGPYNRVNGWLKSHFYSKSSKLVGTNVLQDW